jgi:hypothetical protein
MNKYCHDTYGHPFFGYRHGWRRRFLTDEETKELKQRYKERKIEWLNRYKESLEKELTGVNERLEELTKKK